VPTILFTIVGLALAVLLPPRYRASARVAASPLVPQKFVQAGRDAGGVGDDHAESRLQMRRMREVVYSRNVLETVAKDHKLYRVKDGGVAQADLEDMKKRVKVEVDPDGEMYVGFDGASRGEARDVANQLAGLLVEKTSAVRDRQATQATQVVQTELDRLGTKLSEKERELNAYKLRVGLARPDQLESNLKLFGALQEQLERKTAAIADEEAQRTSILQEISLLERQGAGRSESKEIQDLRFRQKQAEARYTEQHPERIAIERQLHELETRGGGDGAGEASPTYMRLVSLKSDLQARNSRLAAYRHEQAGLQGQLSTYQGRIETAPQHEGEMTQLMRDYETTKTQYQELLSKQQEAKLGFELDQVSSSIVFRLVEPAQLPVGTVAPHRGRIVLMGLFAGLAFGLVLAFVFEQSDTSLASIDELQAFTTIPALAVIPSMESDTTFRPDEKPGIALLTQPRSIFAEQYRVLAVRVREQANKTGSTIVAVTSSVGGEGKTTTAINLALALSKTTEGRVLLVDADLRKPRVAEYLEITAQRGFAHLLQKTDEEDVARYAWRLKDLYVLPGAGTVPDPVGLLSSDRARLLFETLRKEFPIVVVDAPPILPMADAPILTRLSDGVVLVVRANRTPRELLERGVENIDASKVMGIVLNGVDLQKSRYAAAYHYYEKSYLGQ
jgi:polysaccharide chain length determinant protein (PEP-CTERM system associated)